MGGVWKTLWVCWIPHQPPFLLSPQKKNSAKRKQPIHIRQSLYISGQKLILRTKDRKDGMARLVLRSLLPTPGPFHFHTSTIHSKRFAPLCDHLFLRWYLISGHCPVLTDLRDFTHKISLSLYWRKFERQKLAFLKAKLQTTLCDVIFYRLWSTFSRVVHLPIPKKLGKSWPVSRW